MKHIATETEDPLKRIQEEIDEVAQRERELRRQLTITRSPSKSDQEDAVSTVLSDDSGFSASPSPINGQSADTSVKAKASQIAIFDSTARRRKYQNQTILLRTQSTPHIFTPHSSRVFNGPNSKKGLMQKFIASRGKINGVRPVMHTPHISVENSINLSTFMVPPSSILTPSTQIERDSDGRPIRRGFVPVEEKIQKELREMRNREDELKRLRRQIKRSQSQIDLSFDLNDEDYESENEDEEYSFDYPPPGKLRTSKSIGELCDTLNNSTNSPRETPSPKFVRKARDGLRPAVSLAQLCDLEPENAPSSHRLIAQWENIIHQKNQKHA